jgi:PPOX class probable F420-dependent enzyme
MPGYGIRPAHEGTGLLPWSWAEERLRTSHNYWVVTLWPDGRPHAMPVWGIWDDGDRFWFSSSLRSRKARNIAGDPRCTVTTEDARNPVVLSGEGEIRTARDELMHVLALINAKYGSEYGEELMDPETNATIRVTPQWAFGLAETDFTGSPTRWSFPA